MSTRHRPSTGYEVLSELMSWPGLVVILGFIGLPICVWRLFQLGNGWAIFAAVCIAPIWIVLLCAIWAFLFHRDEVSPEEYADLQDWESLEAYYYDYTDEELQRELKTGRLQKKIDEMGQDWMDKEAHFNLRLGRGR